MGLLFVRILKVNDVDRLQTKVLPTHLKLMLQESRMDAMDPTSHVLLSDEPLVH